MQTCERVLESNTFLSSSITLLCVLALVLSAPSAVRQSSSATGRIDGTVLDSSGAAMPSAEIMVRNQGTGIFYNIAHRRGRALHSASTRSGHVRCLGEQAWFRKVVA